MNLKLSLDIDDVGLIVRMKTAELIDAHYKALERDEVVELEGRARILGGDLKLTITFDPKLVRKDLCG